MRHVDQRHGKLVAHPLQIGEHPLLQRIVEAGEQFDGPIDGEREVRERRLAVVRLELHHVWRVEIEPVPAGVQP